jgi:2-hydroxycyclohexanecarboxyl-CoA dehydrogenase
MLYLDSRQSPHIPNQLRNLLRLRKGWLPFWGSSTPAKAGIEEANGTTIGAQANAASRASAAAGMGLVRARLGRPAILVNNAGVSSGGPFLGISPQTREAILAVNLTGTFHRGQAALPDMVNGGRDT